MKWKSHPFICLHLIIFLIFPVHPETVCHMFRAQLLPGLPVCISIGSLLAGHLFPVQNQKDRPVLQQAAECIVFFCSGRFIPVYKYRTVLKICPVYKKLPGMEKASADLLSLDFLPRLFQPVRRETILPEISVFIERYRTPLVIHDKRVHRVRRDFPGAHLIIADHLSFTFLFSQFRGRIPVNIIRRLFRAESHFFRSHISERRACCFFSSGLPLRQSHFFSAAVVNNLLRPASRVYKPADEPLGNPSVQPQPDILVFHQKRTDLLRKVLRRNPVKKNRQDHIRRIRFILVQCHLKFTHDFRSVRCPESEKNEKGPACLQSLVNDRPPALSRVNSLSHLIVPEPESTGRQDPQNSFHRPDIRA